ncbi:hypothetical protein BDN67DRAFT_332574 [Paxillus ammoniavirescens]|nr:hypothetical protein BDN67DRAFT_332574 [Paxillus ammoniavirescens]
MTTDRIPLDASHHSFCEFLGKDSDNPGAPSDKSLGTIIQLSDSKPQDLQDGMKPNVTRALATGHPSVEPTGAVCSSNRASPTVQRCIPMDPATISPQLTTLPAQSPNEAVPFPTSPLRHGPDRGLPRPLNVVVFGESGVGKSSVINMIAGENVTKTSNNAVGCTFRHQCHEVILNGLKVNLWDTAGLDEGTEGTVPAMQAEENLKAFLRQVTRRDRDGIDLLMYCIRGTRVRRALLRNYNIFYAAICRKKVPLALIVTGLENYEGEMDSWWTEHAKDLAKHGMQFDAHACVTTMQSDHPAIRGRLEHSRAELRKLIQEKSETMTWKANEDSLISASLPDVRALMGAMWATEKKMTPLILICDTGVQDQGVAPGTTPSWEECTRRINDREYKHIRADELVHGNLKLRLETKRRPDLLVFCAAASSDPGPMWTSLKLFYSSYGGETCPLIVVFRGLDNLEAAVALWRTLSLSRGGDIVANPTFYPGPDRPKELVKRADGALAELIEGRCLVKFEEKLTKFQKFRRFRKSILSEHK